MNMQEMSTAAQYRLPVKIFILNNEYMGMVRQWQELLHGQRYSHSYSESLPDFVKLAEAYGAVGIRCSDPAELDAKILEMIDSPRPVVFDCRVEKGENCLPMIPSGKAHNEMILPEDGADIGSAIATGFRTSSWKPWHADSPSSRLEFQVFRNLSDTITTVFLFPSATLKR